jgi:hypothetical protein
VAEVSELARRHTALAIKTLVSIMQHSDKDTARVAAAQDLLDRAWGKATQSLDVGGERSLCIYLDPPRLHPMVASPATEVADSEQRDNNGTTKLPF